MPPLPQYALMAWCLVKAQGQLYLYLFTFILTFTCGVFTDARSIYFFIILLQLRCIYSIFVLKKSFSRRKITGTGSVGYGLHNFLFFSLYLNIFSLKLTFLESLFYN
jgi:hypothetical protein